MDKPARLLYVDDGEFDRELVRLALSEAGSPYELVEAGSRADFVGKLSQDFSLVMTDLNILGYSGLDVLQLVKREMPEVPVVILTGTGTEELAVQAMKMGATDYVIKNASHMRRLPHTIEAILENEQLRRSQREAQQRLAEVVEAIDDCYWIYQLEERRFSYLSPAFERIVGFPASLAYEQPEVLWISLPSEEQERLRSHFSSSLPGEMELAWTWPDGRMRKLRVRARRMESRFVGILQDVTPLREAQISLAHSQKMEALGRLAGGVAHDLNNLLTVMLGYGLSLREQLPDNEDLSEILQAVDRSSRLTNQLLTLSRRQLMRPKLLNLNSVVREMQGMFRRLIPADIELELDLCEPLPWVELDLGQWEQVVLNLVINAREAQPQGGLIRIVTSSQHGWVRFEVSDRGPGLAPALREKIFEPFFTTKGKQSGTGLGLATVYGIVAQSGGRIWVESPPGGGSAFVVTFPISNQKEPPVEVVRSEAPPVVKKKPRVLVVEDNDAIRRLVVTLLRREGYEVMEAGNGEQVLQSSLEPVELLVTDFAMPGMTGMELAEKLRPAKVLFTSGCSVSELADRGFRADTASFLPKPFSPIQLREKVHSLLD